MYDNTKKPTLSSISNATDGDWANIVGEVIKLWEPTSSSIMQAGLIQDGTGIIGFVSWTKSDLALLNVGSIYYFKGCPVSKYKDRLSIGLVRTSEIKEL